MRSTPLHTIQTVVVCTTPVGSTCGIGTWLAWDAKYGELAWHTVAGQGVDWLLWSEQGIPPSLIGHIQRGQASALVARMAAKATISIALNPSFMHSIRRPANDLVATIFVITFTATIPGGMGLL